MSAPESILGRFWVDLGTHLGRFWDDFGSILRRFVVDFWGFCRKTAAHAYLYGGMSSFIHARAHSSPQITYIVAMRTRFPFHAFTGFLLLSFWVFFVGLVLGVVSCALLGGSKTVPEPNFAPTWGDFGAMLEPFWNIFGCSFALFIEVIFGGDFWLIFD